MTVRTPIRDFELANPLYKNASVSFYTVAGGAKTSTLAALYSGQTGSAQLSNPQKLNSRGQFKQSVYIEDQVIGSIIGISVPGHDTAIHSPAPTFRVQALTSKLQYSYDGGVTYNDVGEYFFANRGEWVTATTYHRNDFITHAGYAYIALTDHISGTFSTDLTAANWLTITANPDLAILAQWCGTATGTADALTLAPAQAPTAYVAGQKFRFKSSASANTSAVTASVSGLAATPVQWNGSALIGGEIEAGRWYEILYDGTNFQLSPVGGDIVQPTATGGVARRSQSHYDEARSIKDFKTAASGSDWLDAFQRALASEANPTIYVPPGSYTVSAPIDINTNGAKIFGINKKATLISQDDWTGNPLATHFSTVRINHLECELEGLTIHGGLTTNQSDALIIGDHSVSNIAQRAVLKDIFVAHGKYGVRLLTGNLQRWYNVWAESCDYGITVDPDGNTNGCIMSAIGTYGCGLGFQVLQGSSIGHCFSNWDVFVEGCNAGTYVRGGYYCNYDLYVDSLSGGGTDGFDILPGTPHRYFLKNPSNFAASAISTQEGTAMGINGSGAALAQNPGVANNRLKTYSFPAGGSLQGVGTTIFHVTNESVNPETLNLAFLAYAPIGLKVRIIKTDGNGEFTLSSAGSGKTLVGDTGAWGAAATNALLEVTVLSGTEAFCKQS